MTYLLKMLKILIVSIFILTVMSNIVVMAYDVTTKFNGNTTTLGSTVTAVQTVLSTVLDIARYVGVGVALVILMYIGVKFMMAAPAERANIKQYSINYVIGATILIGASGILTLIKTFAQTTITTS